MRKLIAFFALLLALAGTFTPAAAAAAPLLAGTTTTHLYTATANVSRPAPTMNQVETVSARLLDHAVGVPGALMRATWYYKTVVSTCSSFTLASGRASCARSISHATPGYPVRVVITFSKAGRVLASTSTHFTPAGTSGSNTGGASTGGGSSGGSVGGTPSGGRTGATCRDGSHSFATGSGACSHHGGVAVWLYGP